jgi:hypothetical protein
MHQKRKNTEELNIMLYRLSEKGVQTLVWQNQAKAWTPTKIFI